MKFVEDESGNVIDGYRASSIRKFARSLWAGLSNAGKAPKSWGKVDAQTSSQFQIEMCRKFPELRLCKGNWKVDLIATMSYPSWSSNQAKEKEENRKRTSTGSLPDPKRPKPAISIALQARTPVDHATNDGCLPAPVTVEPNVCASQVRQILWCWYSVDDHRSKIFRLYLQWLARLQVWTLRNTIPYCQRQLLLLLLWKYVQFLRYVWLVCVISTLY